MAFDLCAAVNLLEIQKWFCNSNIHLNSVKFLIKIISEMIATFFLVPVE